MPDQLDVRRGVPRDRARSASIFDVDAAAELIATQQAALDAIEPDDRGPHRALVLLGRRHPVRRAPASARRSSCIDAAGSTNIAADVEDTWTSLGWEAIVDADPDVIVLIDADWNTAAEQDRPARVEPRDGALPAVQHAAVPRRCLRGERGGRAQRR